MKYSINLCIYDILYKNGKYFVTGVENLFFKGGNQTKKGAKKVYNLCFVFRLYTKLYT